LITQKLPINISALANRKSAKCLDMHTHIIQPPILVVLAHRPGGDVVPELKLMMLFNYTKEWYDVDIVAKYSPYSQLILDRFLNLLLAMSFY
jgi:hypothetical protein